MKNRPGERARRHLRTVQRRAVKKLWRPIAMFASVLVAISVGVSFLPTSMFLKGFFLGFLTLAVMVIIAWLVAVTSGSYGWSLGKMGEEITAEAVTSSARRRQGWRLVNGIYFDRHGDIDHVLIGPGGVFVIESKFMTGQCRVVGTRVVGVTGREPISQAHDGARKVEKMLKYGSGRFDVTVQPVAVIWGPGRIKMARGWQMVDGVLLCDGPEGDRWMAELDGEVLGEDLIKEIEEFLRNHLDGQDPDNC